jgi:tryptophan synthase beta subunit
MIKRGYYGNFGGAFLPEILVATFDELEGVYNDARRDASFWQEYEQLMAGYSCRPTPITLAQNLTHHFGGGPHLHQARGPQPHRCPQGQQRDGSGAAGAAHGQDGG